jgi:hypothetical protein
MLTTILKYAAIFLGACFALGIVFMALFMRMATSKRGHVEVDKNLSKDFFKKDGKVFYCPGANFFELGPRELKDADFSTFTVLSNYYAKDNQNVYCMENRINDADAETFEVVTDCFARDKNRVYFLQHIVELADPESLVAIEDGYCRDNQHVFYYHDILPECDPTSFEHLKGYYSKDARHAYYQDKLIFSCDGDINTRWLDNDQDNNFILINGRVYAGENQQEVLDPESLVVINKNYLRDSQKVYYFYTDLTAMDNSDPECFEMLEEGYARDKNNVYYYGKIVVDAVPGSFKINRNDEFKYFHAYISDKYLKLIPRNAVEDIGDYAYIYQDELYVQNVLVALADINSFEEIEHPYFRDVNRAYYLANPLLDANPKHFKLLEGGFACDNRHVYFNELKIMDLQPNDFHYVDGMYGQELENTQTGKLVTPDA